MNRHTIEQCVRTICDVCAGRSCLDSCIARIRAAGRCRACRPPSSAARSRNALKVAAALGTLVAFAAFSLLFGEVVCEWNGQAYVCSGFGEEVIVRPGDPNIIGPEVITNVYGCCTNCTAIPPSQLSNLLNQVKYSLEDIRQNRDYFEASFDNSIASLRSKIDEIDGYQNSGYLQDQTGQYEKWASVSNYLLTVDNDQTRVVRTGTGFPTAGPTYKARYLCANDAIYLYATGYEKPRLENELVSVNEIRGEYVRILTHADSGVQMIDDILPLLAATPDCSSLSNGCSGVTGRWCTEEQGNALIALLEEQRQYLLSISNHLHSVDLHLGGLYRTFMTLRGGIPAEDNLDKPWQDIYLSNTTGSFSYGYTNIAERIELLLYGLSGVGTNDTGFTSAHNPFDEGEETAQNEYDRTMDKFEDVENSYELGGVRIQSLWDRLVLFFGAFQHLVGSALEPNTGLVGSFSFQLSSNDFDVPSLSTGQDVGFANTLQSVCRVGMSALYWIAAGIIGVKFYVWFFAKVLFFLKWAWELLHGLFS